MKLKQWLFGVTALSMLAACSDKDIAPGTGSENGSNPNETGSGYLAVQINLPQDRGTRAVTDGGNDNFADGEDYEYHVDNAMIVIFKGKDEKNATFLKAQDLKRPWFTNNPENDQISSSYLAAVKVNDMTTEDKTAGQTYWGLVILNRNGSTTGIETDDDADVLENTEEVKIGGVTIKKGDSFEKVLDLVTENKLVKVTGEGNNATYSNFFMTNAPLSDVAGGGSSNEISSKNIHYLVDLGSTTYPTIEEARANVKNCIYVERAVAKVTCSNAGKYTLKLIDENGNELDNTTYRIKADIQYALTNTNNKSYIVRNVDFKDKHFKWDLSNKNYLRMVGEVAMPKLDLPYHNEQKSLYRTYWCIDPNYSEEMPEADKHEFSAETDKFVDIDKPLYCKENTFNVANQSYANTTMAIFKVDFNIVTNDQDEDRIGDGNLYTKNEDTSIIYISAKAAASQEYTRIFNDVNILAALQEAAKASGLTEVKEATKYLDIKFATNKNNYLLCQSISLLSQPGVFNEAGVQKFNEYMTPYMKDLIDNVNNMNDITVFNGGVSYYYKPIMHFGDIHCPLDEGWTGITTEDVYNSGKQFSEDDSDLTHARKYLGRYGMVRNNWYELSISDITALASPTVPNIDVDLSDDNKEEKKYIGVEIHILSWAKRTQNVEF